MAKKKKFKCDFGEWQMSSLCEDSMVHVFPNIESMHLYSTCRVPLKDLRNNRKQVVEMAVKELRHKLVALRDELNGMDLNE